MRKSLVFLPIFQIFDVFHSSETQSPNARRETESRVSRETGKCAQAPHGEPRRRQHRTGAVHLGPERQEACRQIRTFTALSPRTILITGQEVEGERQGIEKEK